MITLGSLFDGIGVFPLAASRYEITPLWASEIEKVPISITKRHFPNMIHLGNITEIKGNKIPPVDIITFGSPCQNLSQIGNRKGLAGDQSWLFFEAIRIIKEMRNATNDRYPTFALWENVFGAFSSNNGLDFRAVLQSFSDCEIPMPPNRKWTTSGMVFGNAPDIAWRTLNSRYFRTAQARRRIFLLADYRGRRSAEILFNTETIGQVLKDGENGELQVSQSGGEYVDKTGRETAQIYSLQSRKMRGGVQYQNPKIFLSAVGRANRPCPTLLARDPQDIAIHYPDNPEKDHIRKLTPTECERLMGVPDGWTKHGHEGQLISNHARYKALGNSIVLPCAAFIMAGIKEALSDRGGKI